MEVPQVLHMNTGAGETSYARNSTVQRKIISSAKPIVDEALRDMLSTSTVPSSMAIADLGCSSGPNTLLIVSDIIDIVHGECKYLRRPMPEINILLNDLFTNDFNNVFVSLPAFYKKMKEEKGDGFGPCFVSAVPGSFYGRIFPAKSLHFLHSSSSLHWLSQVPPGLEGKAENKGKIYISKSSPQGVLDAYSQQFQKDFSSFLRCRATEMVSGGRMVLTLMGRSTLDPTTQDSCYQWELLAQALMSMVPQGLVEEEKVDNFNAPYYAPCPKEIREEIEKEGSFVIDQLKATEIDWDGGSNADEDTFDPVLSGLIVARTIRAVVESMLVSHNFGGKDVMDDLFRRYGELVGDHLSKTRTKYIDLVISVTRKPN